MFLKYRSVGCVFNQISKIFIEVEVYLSDLKGEIMEERKVPERM